MTQNLPKTAASRCSRAFPANDWQTYIDELFDQYYEFDVLHLEATYLPKYADLMNTTMLEITKERFLDSPEKAGGLLDGMIGYVWCANRHMQLGNDQAVSSLTQHFILLFKPSEGDERVCAECLADYLAEICKGTATCRFVDLRSPDHDDMQHEHDLSMQTMTRAELVNLTAEITGTSYSGAQSATQDQSESLCVMMGHAGNQQSFAKLRKFMLTQ